MASEELNPRSRRALLAAAAGAAGALAASAAMPLAAAAAPANLQTEQDNPTIATTSVTDSAAASTALAGHATGTGSGFGLEGTSASGGGVVGWSVTAPDPSWFVPSHTSYTGVFGSAPANPDPNISATGVWGDSSDIGVLGTGGNGVVGFGRVGVVGEANELAGSIAMWAFAPPTNQVALRVTGKVNFSRSGRRSMVSGNRSKTVLLPGVSATSKVFAVLGTSESGRWVRAVVPAAGKFTIYLNTALTSSAVVSWFVLD